MKLDETRIMTLGRECRKLAEQGKRLNKAEARLFHRSLYMDLQTCENIIKTLKGKTQWTTANT